MSIEEVLQKYFPKSLGISFKKFGKGIINLTYLVEITDKGKNTSYILQKMNNIFGVSVMEDIDNVTKYLTSKNILVQRVIKTLDDKLFVEDDISWWRLLTFIPGKTFSEISSLGQAYEAGKLIGNFHDALLNFNYEFKFKLSHYHDVEFDVETLRVTLLENKDTSKYYKLHDLAQKILDSFDKLPKLISLPKRIIHNDLKISNILFDVSGEKAVSLIDLDTFTCGFLAVELGDALRSWCIPGGEDDENVKFDLNVYNSALDGYYSTAKFITEKEKESIPFGVKMMTLDLAARFTIDAFNESYWQLDSSKYKNLFEQNKKKAENQFAFFKEFVKRF